MCSFRGTQSKDKGTISGYESIVDVDGVESCDLAASKDKADLSANHRVIKSACYKPHASMDLKKRPVCSEACQYKDVACYLPSQLELIKTKARADSVDAAASSATGTNVLPEDEAKAAILRKLHDRNGQKEAQKVYMRFRGLE
jgi:hypothetical protein